MGLTIDKGVPLPPRGGKGVTDAIRKMEKGDSFFLAGKRAAEVGGFLQRPRRDGGRYAARTMEGGVRIWCLEPVRKEGGQ